MTDAFYKLTPKIMLLDDESFMLELIGLDLNLPERRP